MNRSGAREIRWLRYLPILPLILAGYWSVRLACADYLYRQGTLDSTRRAAQLDPGNARIFVWLAELAEHEGEDPTPPLERARALDPRDSSILIRLGLLAEQRGEFAAAERDLLAAAQIDHQCDPRSTLANYYFRRQDAANFWRWVRQAFAVNYGDPTSLLHLAWRMTDRPEVVRAALPPDRALIARYLSFLLATDRLDAAAALIREVDDRAVLLDATDRFLERPYTAAAVAAWNRLGYGPLAPERGASLSNPTFANEFVLRGFDWRVPNHLEISVTRDSSPSLRLALTGRQPESCELLAQLVPLAPRRKYRFRFHYRTEGAGFHWQILGADRPVATSSDWTTADLLFDSGDADLARLTLVYRRPPASARFEGSIALRDLALGFAE